MLALHQEIERLRRDHQPMPDRAMDALGDAAAVLRSAIIDAPVTCEADVASKFRLVAALIEHESGEFSDEYCAAAGAFSDLAAFRNEEWKQDIGSSHPNYAAHVQQ
ncbi:hypothetical protein [Sinorhizobium fredii]|uniref:hypothetical protein n=1 Tax=Rhizobium fredii TaxID=380 RepID=UPI003516903E